MVVARFAAVAQAQLKLLRLHCRHIERSVQPIPNRELEAAIATEMPRLAAMVKLVMRGADQPASPRWAIRQPDRRVAQVVDEVEREEGDVPAEEGIDADRSRHDRVERDGDKARGDDRAPRHQQELHRMCAEGRHGREHFRRMVNLVEFPKHRHVVQQAVHGEAAEIVGEEEGQREEHSSGDPGEVRCGWRLGESEGAAKQAGEASLVDQDESKGGGNDQRIGEVKPVIRLRGAMPPDLAAEVLAPEIAPWLARRAGGAEPAPGEERDDNRRHDVRPIEVRVLVHERTQRLCQVVEQVMRCVVHTQRVQVSGAARITAPGTIAVSPMMCGKRPETWMRTPIARSPTSITSPRTQSRSPIPPMSWRQSVVPGWAMAARMALSLTVRASMVSDSGLG